MSKMDQTNLLKIREIEKRYDIKMLEDDDVTFTDHGYYLLARMIIHVGIEAFEQTIELFKSIETNKKCLETIKEV